MSGTKHSLGALALLGSLALALASCGAAVQVHADPPTDPPAVPAASPTTVPAVRATAPTTGGTTKPASRPAGRLGAPLPVPAALASFGGAGGGAQAAWRPAGRLVGGKPAVYETSLVPPGGTQPAGIAWMDTHRLAARLYSGSGSPGGGPYRYSAPVAPAQAASLVAAFNGGFKMSDSPGGYYTEGHVVAPLVTGAASLVIYAGGRVDIGSWGSDVTMTPSVVSVRQNLVPLVAGGGPTAQAQSTDWQAWGSTCGASSCAASVPGIEHQWRSGLGVTANGALVYAGGPALDPLQVAQLLVRAGVVRGMELDINPYWTVFATYAPAAGGLASASNGSRLGSGTVQGPATFFESSWARDFVTVSARTPQMASAR
ncbi:MAG: hypothetical protein ACRDY2_07370 [Acidimicrobiales bacterium]